MPRHNHIGEGSKETPQPEDLEAVLVDPLGRDDRKAAQTVLLDDEEGNTKPRRVSKTTGAIVV